MNALRRHWPETLLVSLLAALTTWVTLLSWSPFHERPSGYLVPLLGICLLVAATGVVLRLTPLPALAVAAGQVLVVGLWLNHDFAGSQAVAGWLPTAESWAEVRRLLGAASEAARTHPAPIPRDVTEFAPLMVVSGAAVAILVDLLAAGLRRAPVAGLPLLAVYTAPVSILDGGVSWLKFAIAALCFLFLVAAQEESRLGRWGQQVSGTGRFFDTQDTRVSHRAVWGSARKIGLTATGLAVLVPLLVPTMSLGLLDGPGSGSGDGDPVAVDNPMVDMRRDLSRGVDVDLVRVRTTDPDNGYLRLTVLDSYDGDAWRHSRRDIPPEQRADGLLPRPPGLEDEGTRRTVPWDIEVLEQFGTSWLPAPYPAFSVQAAGDWRYDADTLDFVSPSDDARGLAYDVQRLVVEPRADEMAFAPPAPASVFGPNTKLPDSFPVEVSRLARSVTAGARSKYEMAVALQRWFRVDGEFEYSLDPDPGNGIDDLQQFLTPGPGGREGYCEQFASAMALMGRSLAIPSRVAVGFLRPAPQEDGSYVYSAHDMHAWPEMYFEGTGWVRFEPTPGGRTGGTPPYTRQPVDRESPSATASSSAIAPSGLNRIDQPSAAPGTGQDSGGAASTARNLLAGASGALLALALAFGPRALRSAVRRRRWESATTAPALAEAAWAELRDDALDLGITWDDRVTLRTRARDLVRGFGRPEDDEDALGRGATRGSGANPDAEAALSRIVQLVERARYARELPTHAAQRSAVQDDVALCRAAMQAGAGARRRSKATWLPASLWSRWADASRRPSRHTEAVLGQPGVDRAI